MIDEKEFLKDIEEFDDELKENLIEIYELNNLDHNTKEDNLEIANLIQGVLNKLFNPRGLYKEPMIPFSFFETRIGKSILTALGTLDNRMYTINDLISMTETEEKPEGYTYQYISQEIKAGRLEATKDSGRWVISYPEVQRYLKSKGLKK